jgi:hypothetical protein
MRGLTNPPPSKNCAPAPHNKRMAAHVPCIRLPTACSLCVCPPVRPSARSLARGAIASEITQTWTQWYTISSPCTGANPAYACAFALRPVVTYGYFALAIHTRLLQTISSIRSFDVQSDIEWNELSRNLMGLSRLWLLSAALVHFTSPHRTPALLP